MRVVTGRTRHPCDDDYDGLLFLPEPPGFSPVWHAHQRTHDRHGNDPVVGRRLVQLLHQAGLVPRRNTFVFFGVCAGDRDFEDLVRNIASIVDEAIDDIIATGFRETPSQQRSTLLSNGASSRIPRSGGPLNVTGLPVLRCGSTPVARVFKSAARSSAYGKPSQSSSVARC
jgi:hypothetical protein